MFVSKELSMRVKVLAYIAISSICIGILFWLIGICGIGLNMAGKDNLSIMLSQISSTFIVLSLTSILSTDVGNVYWQDIKDFKLIKPFIYCFYALTTYLITAMILSIIGFFAGSLVLQISSFAFSVMVLIVLTVRMLSLYFGRDSIKNELRWEYFETLVKHDLNTLRVFGIEERCDNFLKEFECSNIYLSKRQLDALNKMKSDYGLSAILDDSDTFSGKLKTESEKVQDKYDEYTGGLIENTLQAIAANDRSIVKENIDLLLITEDYETLWTIMDTLIKTDPVYAVEIIHVITSRARGKDGNRKLLAHALAYAKAAFHIILQEGCSNDLMKRAILNMRKENKEKAEVRKSLYKYYEEIPEDELHRIEEQFRNKAMIDYYFPYTELLEAYSNHEYSLCVQIIEVLNAIHNEQTMDFMLVVKVKHGENPKYRNDINFKYLTDDIWNKLERFIKMDEDAKAIPEDKKDLLRKMRNLNVLYRGTYL